jgi:hypothetical protein
MERIALKYTISSSSTNSEMSQDPETDGDLTALHIIESVVEPSTTIQADCHEDSLEAIMNWFETKGIRRGDLDSLKQESGLSRCKLAHMRDSCSKMGLSLLERRVRTKLAFPV